MSRCTAHRSRRLMAAAAIVAVLAALAGCGQDSAKKKFQTVSSNGTQSFAIYDQTFTPLAGADLYLDAATTPAATSDSAGHISVAMSGIHDVHILKANYSGRSYINRDWSTVNQTSVVRLAAQVGVGTFAAVTGNVNNSLSGDGTYRMRTLRTTDGISSILSNLPSVNGATPFSVNGFLGTDDLFLYTADPTLPGTGAVAGFAGPFSVSVGGVTQNIARVLGGGLDFSVDATGGVPGGSLSVGYALQRDPYNISTLVSNATNLVAATSYSGQAFAVPPFESVYPGGMYAVTVTSQTTAINARVLRTYVQNYFSFSELGSATLPAFTLPDYAIAFGTPADLSVSQGTQPAFSWTGGTSAPFVEIFLNEYNASYPGYVQTRWQAWVFNQSSATYPSIFGPLGTNTAYQYTLQGRTNHFDASQQYRGNDKDGWSNIRFSTGPTSPP